MDFLLNCLSNQLMKWIFSHFFRYLSFHLGNIKNILENVLENVSWILSKRQVGCPMAVKHNEVAPGQHEMSPVFRTANVSCDTNVLFMEVS